MNVTPYDEPSTLLTGLDAPGPEMNIWDEEAAAAELGLEFSRGDFRSLGYGERPDAAARQPRYDLTADEHDELLRELARRPRTYRGVGPRGWRRQDERILEDVSERFTWHGDLDASGIAVSVHAGEVILRGHVPTRRERWLAEDLAEAVSGVSGVRSELRVQGRS